MEKVFLQCMGPEVHSLSLYQVFNGLLKLYFWLLPDSSAVHLKIKDSVTYIRSWD